MSGWGESRSRLAFVVLLGCLVLLASAPAALAAESTGQITGTVTKAGGIEAIAGIEVCAYELEGPVLEEGPFVEHCVKTNASGVYTISGLPSGEYDVEFLVPFESGLNYIAQYYNDKSSFSEAQAVPVAPGAIVPNIDAALTPGGEIKGTVKEAALPHSGVKNIQVTVYEAGGKEFPVGFATTKSNGEYTVVGLATGSYKVGFSPGVESGLNFVTQYYEHEPTLEAAKSLKVKQEEVTAKINAELEVGGEISGTVTDASTHTPLSNINVFAIGSGEVFAGVANTNASGEYTIPGLASGSYKLEFIELGSGSPYITQYYNNQPSLATANPVTANQGSTTPGINAALVPKRPVNMAGPVASGTPAVGKTLSCSSGSWTGEPKPTFTYVWLRNGVAIAGAIASTYVIQTADQGAGLACRVTATNKHSSAAAVSNTLAVPAAPPPPPPVPVLTLLSAKIIASGSSARVPVSCANANCTGTIELTEQVVVKHRHHGKTRSKRETLVLGRGSYTLSAGQSATILVRLTHTGKKALATARHHRLSATARVSLSGGVVKYVSILLSEKPKKHRHR